MFKVGEYLIAKDRDTITGKVTLLKNKRYQVINYYTIGGIDYWYLIKDERNIISKYSQNFFYTKQELRELKLNNLLCLR